MATQQQRPQGPQAQASTPQGQTHLSQPAKAPEADEKTDATEPAEPKQKHRVLSRVFVDKKTHGPGELIDLTVTEAKSMGDAVTSNLKTLEVENLAEREAGVYEIVGPGSVWLGGRSVGLGAVLELSAVDAREFGKLVKKVE